MLEYFDIKAVAFFTIVVGFLLYKKIFNVFCETTTRLDGKIVIVTGGNTGIGKETVKDLAKRGATVIMACRDMKKAEAAQAEIKKETLNDNVFIRHLELGSLKSINNFVISFLKEFHELHILINNAAIVCPYQKTEDGFEMQFGVNHLGHFALTNLLLKRMRETKGLVRVINVSSHAHYFAKIKFDDINSEKSYGSQSAYAQSKLANIMFTKELQRRLSNTNIITFAVHPGFVSTEIGRNFLLAKILLAIFRIFQKSPKLGAQTSIYCAVTAGLEKHAGKYFADCSVAKIRNKICDDEGQIKKLWEISESMTKISFPL
ncbi:retinol dehydrogenase 11-like [Hydra vulgaris]|uniref:Retinol dehydrogenase 11-like n=1 Tax=Hydra vulgaris TaxID=6087 RepID=A0ABM4DDD4_HYDVU